MKMLRNKWLPMSMLLLATSVAQAGVVKVALFPVAHAKKTAHGLKKAGKKSFSGAKKTVKGVSKAAYNL
jgi:hypothetical protein